MNKKLFRIFSTILVVAVTLTACSGTQPVASAKTPLRVGWSLWPGYYPMAIAVDKGFFEKHGVQVDPVFYSTYGDQSPDLASGMIDGGVTVFSDALFDAISSQTKVVLILDNSSGADQLVASSDIKSPKDVRGKRIGVQSSTVGGTLLVRAMLNQNGISPSEVTFVQVPPEKVSDAIPGKIDLGYTFDPFASQARAKGDTVLFTSADAPGVIVDVLAFRKDIIASRPADVKAFAQAWLEAVQYWKDNPAEGNAIIARATGQNVSGISAQGVTLFDAAANQKAFTQGSDPSSLYVTARNELQFLVEGGYITNPIDVNLLLDASFLK